MVAYFDRLNYTLANEDTRIEQELLPKGAAGVFAVSGSGSRVLPLLARSPKRLVVNDLVREQLFLCELRLTAARQLAYPEFLFLMGYRGAVPGGALKGESRRQLLETLPLSRECKEFWMQNAAVWAPRGFIWLGKWESHFRKVAKVFQKVVRLDARAVFEAQSLEEQAELYRRHWKPTLFRNFLKIVANEFVFNRFLYKGHFAGAKERRTEERPPWKFLDEEFRRLFETTLVRKSYFLQMLFLGGLYYEEGFPTEALLSTWQSLRDSSTEIVYRQGDLLEQLEKEPAFSFYSLSDVISYLPEEGARGILQRIPAAAPRGTQVVIRSFLRAPREIDQSGWEVDVAAEKHAYAHDLTGVYRFHIYKKA